MFPVVHGEIPVAGRAVGAGRPGPPESYRKHSGKSGQVIGHIVNEH